MYKRQQLDTIEGRLDETETQIEALKVQLGELDSAQEISNTQNQITALQTVLNTLHNTYANLLASTNQEAINTLTIIEPAVLPSRPIGTDQMITILLSAVVGLALATSAAYLLEYVLDTSLKFPEDIENIFQTDVLGHFFSNSWFQRKKTPILLTGDPAHPSAEAFRILKTNLLFMDNSERLKTILISSPEKQKGKTQLSVNLALSLATGDKKVILVDADLRIPAVHTLLGLANEKGLGDVLTHQATLEEVFQTVEEGHLRVIPAGVMPPDLVERLDSPKMAEIFIQLKEMADIIIIDAPPFFVAETSVLAAQADGILAIIRPGYSKKEAVKNMADQIARSHARLLGVVINGIPAWGTAYFAKVRNNRYLAR